MNPVNWPRIASVLLFSVAASPCAAAAPETDVLEKASAAFVATAKRVLPGIVVITTTKKPSVGEEIEAFSLKDLSKSTDEESVKAALKFLRRSRPLPQTRSAERSSGFLVSAAGLIVTASYVVEGADKIMVGLHNGKELEAKLVGADPKSQVAVLRIEGENFPVLRLGDSSEVEVGQWVMSAGYPFGLRSTVGFGIIGAVGVHGLGTAALEDYILTNAATQRGCSGGPLVNIRGDVIGMNVAIASRNGSFEGVSFAVPANTVKVVKDQIAASGKMVYSYLGIAIREVEWELAESLGLDEPSGVHVTSVLRGTPAQEAGLAKGDIILEMDGKAVAGAYSLTKIVAFTPPNTQVTLTIVREGERKRVDVKLRTRPESD
jgi:serine protease Do